MSILDIKALEIFDSRGFPTVEVSLKTAKGTFRAAVPSGASTGIYEAVELRDDDKSRLLGKGVLKAVSNVNTIIKPALIGKNVTDQKQLDDLMVQVLDGTKNQYGWSKSKLGANAILAVSLAAARAGAAEKDQPLYAYVSGLAGRNRPSYTLPVPALNIINGGKHAGNSLAFQELMILPTGAKSFREAMTIGAEVYQHLKTILKSKYGLNATNVGDEGGFAPDIKSAEEGLELIMQAIEKSNHKGKVEIGMDVAASELYTEDGKYDLDFKNPNNEGSKKISPAELINYYKDLVAKFPIISIEDPFDQDDWESYAELTRQIGSKVQIVGDDLLVTNPTRVQTAIDKKACNALLLKVNQIGSLTEAIEASNLAVSGGFGVMVSHRSGETEDTFIADLVVGLGTGQIKTGAPCRSERLAKYNQILRIEDELGNFLGRYAGTAFKAIASPFYHHAYKYCFDEKEANAFGWAFINNKDALVPFPFKLPPIGPRSVVVDITHTGLNHTDYHFATGEFGPAPFPFIAGHELVGVVSYIGSDVKRVKVGDRVGYGPQRECCESCKYCLSGEERLCTGVSGFDQYLYPYHFGGYATRTVQPDTNVYKIPEILSSEQVPPLLCAGVTTFAPLKKHVKSGQKVAIIGIGGLGHLAVQYATKLGAKVTAFSSTKEKEELIKKLGAEHVVNSTDLNEIAKHNSEFDVVMNTTSTGDPKLYSAWTSLTAVRGIFIAVGCIPADETPSLNLAHLQWNEITIVGSIIGNRKDHEETLDFSAKHGVLPVIKAFEFEDFPKAFQHLAQGKPEFCIVVNCENYAKKHGWYARPINS